jgi:hypothetical protein
MSDIGFASQNQIATILDRLSLLTLMRLKLMGLFSSFFLATSRKPFTFSCSDLILSSVSATASSDNWIYHRDWKLEDVVNYVRKENDSFRIEGEYEEGNEDNLR